MENASMRLRGAGVSAQNDPLLQSQPIPHAHTHLSQRLHQPLENLHQKKGGVSANTASREHTHTLQPPP